MNSSIYSQPKFSLIGLLGFMTIVGLIAMRNSFWGIVFSIELIAVHTSVFALVRNLPQAILSVIERNCLSSNGAFDAKRVHAERQDVNRLYWQLFGLFLVVVLLPVNWAIWSFAAFSDWSWAEYSFLFTALFVIASFALVGGYLGLLRRLQIRTIKRQEEYWLGIDQHIRDPLNDQVHLASDNNAFHAKPDLRVFRKWTVTRSGSVIVAVIRLNQTMRLPAIAVASLIAFVTLLANSGAGSSLLWFVQFLPGKDLAGHFGLYGALGFTLSLCLKGTLKRDDTLE